ncbi:MAG: hypothetical protein ACREAA_07125 [Candidatus Polarisedimenticolia bacterium]
MIAETVSRKAGRPRILLPEWEAALRGIYPEIRTLRGIQNRSAQLRAVKLLSDDPAFAWLVDPRTGWMRQTILQHLGRVESDAMLVEAARAVCEQRPSSVRARTLIRAVVNRAILEEAAPWRAR